MKLTNRILLKYGVDKVLHFCVCGWVESICCTIGFSWMFWGLFVVAIISIAKELFDAKFDIYDILAGMSGGIIAATIYMLLLILCNI